MLWRSPVERAARRKATSLRSHEPSRALGNTHMTRHFHHALVVASISCGLLAATPARAASVTKVSPQSAWGASGVPSYVTMYIYVPDTLAEKPPILVAHHSCGTPVSGYVGSISKILAAADQNGFVLILPEATNQNCWDV